MFLNLKKIKTFKVIITTLLVITFTVSMISCKEAPAVIEEQQGEEKGEVTIPSETKEETKETPSVVEEAPEKIEWEGVTFFPVEGLRFDKGIFYFMEGNKYGGVVGEEGGILIPEDAIEINGVMQAAFGFVPSVLKVMQKKMMEEEKEFGYFLPIDLEKAKGIKIKEVTDTQTNDWAKSEGLFWDNNTYLEISNVPIGTIIYSPVNSQEYLIWDNNLGRNDPQEPSWFQLGFSKIIPEVHRGNLFFKNERVDMVDLYVELTGVSLLPSGIEKNITKNEDGGYSFLTEIKLGETIAEVVSKDNLHHFDEPDYNPEASYNPDLSSIEIYSVICQLKNKNDKEEFSNISKLLDLGSVGFLEKENIPVFIKPAYE